MKQLRVRVSTGGRCEDCDLRDALTLTGKPRRHPHTGLKLTGACEQCGGTGRGSRTVVLGVSVLRMLTPKQRFVIERRLGIFDGTVYKQREIAELMGITRQSVSELESNARNRLLALANPAKKPAFELK